MSKVHLTYRMSLFMASLCLGLFSAPGLQASVPTPKVPGLECDQAVCTNYFETENQVIGVNIVVLSNAQGHLRPQTYSLWAVAMQDGRELGRAPVSEDRAGNHAQIILGSNFSGNFEIYFTDFKGHYYSNFGQNFQFEIDRD
jgi:hypothetical protein